MNEQMVVVGAGAAGQAAATVLGSARVISRPGVTVWHAEPGLLWTESADGVAQVPFDRLLLCCNEPLLLMALGCGFERGRVVVDQHGATSVPGVFAAGCVLGATTADEAARQGRIAAQAAAGKKPEGRIALPPLPDDTSMPERLDPLSLAALLEQPSSPDRTRTVLAQARARGPGLSGIVAPARPVGFAALAAMAPSVLPERGIQSDAGVLKGGAA